MVFKHLADYHLWAGWKMRELLSTLEAEEFSEDVMGKSPRELVQHIVLALETCFFFIEGEKDESVFDRVKRFPRQELLKRWEVLDTRLSQAIEEIPQDKIMVKHIKEEPFEIDVIDFFLQYLIHTTHHRGQLAMILSRKGLEIPGTDYLMFFGENV
ncbi:MAG: DinB family protein [Candidatus Thorarchaeota archaeon]